MNKAAIAELIPHAGAMCLLDSVIEWDTTHIRCTSRTHRDADNPLRSDGQLHAMCGVEYAAQAMALHGGLSGKVDGRPRAGYLVGLREVVCQHPRLDTFEDDLTIDAAQLMGDQDRVIYEFNLRAGTTEILKGRATVVLDAT